MDLQKRNSNKIRWLGAMLTLLTLIYGLRLFHDIPKIQYADLTMRHRELRLIEEGIYPRRGMYPDLDQSKIPDSVYPPFSFPLIWLAAPFDEIKSNQAWLLAINILSVAGVAAFAANLGRPHGRSGALLLALSTTSLFSVSATMTIGQLSLVINGLLVIMLLAMQANRPWLAALAWCGSMMKPHSTLLAAALFLRRKFWPALIVAAFILTGFSWAVVWHCNLTLPELASFVASQPSFLKFISRGNSLTSLLAGYGYSPLMLTLAALCGVAVIRLVAARLAPRQPPLLIQLALTLGIMRIVFYHRPYDNIMLVFMIIALGKHALDKNTSMSWLFFVLTGLTVWLPWNPPNADSGRALINWLSSATCMDANAALQASSYAIMVIWVCAMTYLYFASRLPAPAYAINRDDPPCRP